MSIISARDNELTSLLVRLSSTFKDRWVELDVSRLDETVVLSYVFAVGTSQMFMLCKHDDGELSLVLYKNNVVKSVTNERYQIEWLIDKLSLTTIFSRPT